MTGYCVMVTQPNRSQVYITGPFLTLKDLSDWITENRERFPGAKFSISIPKWFEVIEGTTEPTPLHAILLCAECKAQDLTRDPTFLARIALSVKLCALHMSIHKDVTSQPLDTAGRLW